jgi:hypothetical protein
VSELRKVADFQAALQSALGDFTIAEQLIREQYDRNVAAGRVPPGADDHELLERPTRRFLIDGILQSLDWNPQDPTQVAEEARSWDQAGNRLYFDYLGIAPHTRTPVILVEAKGFDAALIRLRRDQRQDSITIAERIGGAIAALKAGETAGGATALWAEWLRDLHTYVLSLGELGRRTLRRVVITSGRWLIVFEDPVAAFISPAAPLAEQIHCFISLDDIIDRHETIYRLLHRQALVDTLSLTMPLAEALEFLSPASISEVYRGVVVATRETGAKRRQYPTRSLWPAVIVVASGRQFVVTDYASEALEEPLDPQVFDGFLENVSARGAEFERRVLRSLGRDDLRPGELSRFGGFRHGVGSRISPVRELNPVSGSSAALMASNSNNRPRMVSPTGEAGSSREYAIATGQDWFYKHSQPSGDQCQFHEWPKARDAGVAAPQPHIGRSETSFTRSGLDLHCAHEELRCMRSTRCHIDVVESHLCCRACIFYKICWETEYERLPCPP